MFPTLLIFRKLNETSMRLYKMRKKLPITMEWLLLDADIDVK